MLAGISKQGGWNAGDEPVTGIQQYFATGTPEETSSDDETRDSQVRLFPDNQMQPAELEPNDTEDGRLCCAEQQESSMGGMKGQKIALPTSTRLDFGVKLNLNLPLQMQEILSRVSCEQGPLIKKYLEFRQLLGNDVRSSHETWGELQAADDHPLLKVAGLAFGVISTPETASYMEHHWDQIKELMGPSSPDSIMARAMMDYALAWAYQGEDLPKALKIVKEFYNEMEDGDTTNFFLAPCYTVTIGRWTYDANYDRLSFEVIEKVKQYADQTLRQLRSLKDEWAKIDTFGTRLNALLLLLRVKEFYSAKSCNTERLEREIENLLEWLQGYVFHPPHKSHPQITTYDKAGFYSVRRIYYKTTNKEEFDRCAKKAAKLFRENGRMRRALEEARHSADAELVREISQEAQDVP